MNQESRKSGGFFRETLSEPDGPWSFARIISLIIVVFDLGWITYLVVRNGNIPDQGGIAALLAALYGINKAAAAVEAFAENDK